MFEEKLAREFNEDRIAGLARPDLGPFNFEAAVPRLRMIRELGELVDRNADWAPTAAYGDGNQELDRAIAAMQAIEAFNPRIGDPGRLHDEYDSQVEVALEGMKRIGLSLFGRDVSRDLAARTGELDARVATLDRVLSQVQSQADTIDKIYKAAQPKGAAIGGTRFANYYEAQGKSYTTASRRALEAAGLSLMAIALVALNPFHWLGADATVDSSSPNALLQWVVAVGPRFVLGGLGLYALRFFARLHGANRQLEALNFHRRNALDTFVLFTEGRDPAEVQTVLTALTGAIFRDPTISFVSTGESKLEVPWAKISIGD